MAVASALSAPVAQVGMSKGKGKVSSKSIRVNDVCIHCREKGHWKRECPKLLSSAGTFVIEVNMITNSSSWYWIPAIEVASVMTCGCWKEAEN
ncbi:UNVERIFIED_CONTAM: hypothetical protein Sangu_3102700 [Sesamum angustifolium]|uniref:CCHC-type domain-containing protein n=1 Tax=Sesamum angustifolium TaxID=2727405 RepID=A0AAW2K997_9LAMI